MLEKFIEVIPQSQTIKEHVRKIRDFQKSQKLKFLGTNTWFIYSDVLYNIELKDGDEFIGSYSADHKLKVYKEFYSKCPESEFKDETSINETISDFTLY